LVARGRRAGETREGYKCTVIGLDVDEVGPSLRSLPPRVNKTAREGTGLHAVPDDEPPF